MTKPDRLIGELKSGKLHPVYLLLGENRGEKMDFVEALKEAALPSREDASLALTVFFGDEVAPERILENLRTYSFFAEKRVVIVHDVDRLGSLDSLSSYLEQPNEDAVLVLLTDRKSLSKGFTDRVDGIGRSCTFWPLFREQSVGWVKSALKNIDIEVTPDAIGFIADMTGGGTSELKNQLEILQNHMDRGETLTLEKARAITASLKELSVFDLANSLFVRESGEILRLFRRLIENGEDLVKIHYFCSREIHRLYRCFTLSKEGIPFQVLSQRVGLRKREAARTRGILGRVSEGVFSSIFKELALLDSTIKSRPRPVARVSYEIFLSGLGGRDA
jgi:DNA polymerase-3 subunit delta